MSKISTSNIRHQYMKYVERYIELTKDIRKATGKEWLEIQARIDILTRKISITEQRALVLGVDLSNMYFILTKEAF